ncbi:hypothetical protein GCM10010495_20260 [Kitasatospora herbaricolor]|nr:hypothetical protein GCM10010495_20260 [Kitasatospora herbaricolor]
MHLVGGEVDVVAVEHLGHDPPLCGQAPAAHPESFQQVTHAARVARAVFLRNGSGLRMSIDLDKVQARLRLLTTG